MIIISIKQPKFEQVIHANLQLVYNNNNDNNNNIIHVKYAMGIPTIIYNTF